MYVAGGYNQNQNYNYNNDSGAPMGPAAGMTPMYPQGYPQNMGPGYAQPVVITAPTQPNTVIIKEKPKDDSGVAEGCCAGMCAACLACLCCCCMAAAASPSHHHHRGRW